MVVGEARIERWGQEPAAPMQDQANVKRQRVVILPTRLRTSAAADEILIGFLADARLYVKSPIKVKFTPENEDFIAEAVDLDEFGFGDSRSAALRDLQRAIVELYFTLKADRDALGSDLQALWSRLQENIQEHDNQARRI